MSGHSNSHSRNLSLQGIGISGLHNRRESLVAHGTPPSPMLVPIPTRATPDLSRSSDMKRGYDEQSDYLIKQEAKWRPMRPIPRNAQCLRTTAMAGWLFALILFFTLIVSHSTLGPEFGRVDLAKLPHKAFDVVERVAFDHHIAKAPSHAPVEYAARPGGLQSKVTIVSSFYRVDNNKKHKVDEYHHWLTSFFGSVEQPILFYCAPELKDYILGLRGNKPITLITDYKTPFDMPPLEELGGRDWAENQYKIDPEQQFHVPDVYAVWTSKPWMVRNAAELDPYHSEYFFWVDAGAFRTEVIHDLKGLPETLDKLYAHLPDDTLVLSATLIPFDAGLQYVKSVTRGKELDRVDILQGGWYGGKRSGVEWWERETMKVTVLQAALQRFSAKEQPVWTQAAALNWEKIYVQNMAHATGDCGADMWFTFLFFADGRDCKVPAWNGPEYALIEAEKSKAATKAALGSAAEKGGMKKQVKKPYGPRRRS